jgi:arsenical pump membrane protein
VLQHLDPLGAVAINNLPAASLLSAHSLAHPFFLLLGLNLGPNLAITGSLSAILWLRLARENGAEASIWRYSRLGLVIAPLQLAGAAAALALLHPAA